MKWISTFRYLPIEHWESVTMTKTTVQVVSFDNNVNADSIRIRFSNRYSRTPLTLSAVTIGKVGEKETAAVTKDGVAVVVIPAGAEFFSDAVDFSVRAGERLAVAVTVDAGETVASYCSMADVSGAFVQGGVCDRPEMGQMFYGFSGVQVLAEDEVRVVAAFGDSITHMSYVTNALSRRLYAAYPGKVSLVNCGIGGNRICSDATYVPDMPGHGRIFGEAGIKRFGRDVFGLEPVDAVILLEGVNDIMHPGWMNLPEERVNAGHLIRSYKELCSLAHRMGAKMFGCTITPCRKEEDPMDWLELYETVRLETNEAIRSGLSFDGYFDYDAAVRDEGRPAFMREGTHVGDGLHPNAAGGEAMAAVVDLEMLMK